ncbi:MAG: Beta-galactosidase/beta-glucuronidase domain protein [Ignavibacteria bacterium]|nr:MAG: Beta-galactosidase/beta-glucuronidase domain protein [Ignavibacteria bacterium]KAF0160393.1 MAG: Beta-galactosidase/beta-glucuronidase domain protein [Ignavibacteria bacterium]
MTIKLISFYCLILLFPILNLAEIKVTSLPSNKNQTFDRILFGSSDTRNVFLINDSWNVYHASDYGKKVKISVPAVFDGIDVLVFEKNVEFTEQQIKNNQIKIGFLGLSNSAEISLNGNTIFIHYGGAVPFDVSLPKDILRWDKANKITVKVNSKLDSEATIPTKQRFLFPEFSGGIIRDVYLKIVPQLSISKVDYSYTLGNLNSGKINFDVHVENTTTKEKINQQTQFYVLVNLYNSAGSQFQESFSQVIGTEENYDARFEFYIQNPVLWSPESPNVYLSEISLIKDGVIIDKHAQEISFYQLNKSDNSFLLNGNPFAFNGTTYFLNETQPREKNLYEKIREELSFIKQTGFNSIRFAKSYPHPYALKVCQELGLFALVELPLNSVPEHFLEQNEYKLKLAGFAKEFLSNYLDYTSALLMGVGSGFLPNSFITEKFLTRVASEFKKKNILSYASFVGVQTQRIENVDLFGLEIFSVTKDLLEENLTSSISALGNSSIFLSELTYPNYKGSSAGYLVKNSKEAQAKYFEDVINLSRKNKISGFFINSLFGYRGAFPSMFAGFNEQNKYGINVINHSGNTNFIAYKVLKSKLTGGSKVTIPIGSRKEDNPIAFIIIALALSVTMAVLINTKRKFREDATRALIRPYNFFADIRDHRILSGIHSSILMLIIAASAALLVTIILFYLHNNILFEKLLLSFASSRLMLAVSYLAWNPQTCFVILLLAVVLKIALLSLIIKFGAFFVKTKVPLSSIYFTIIWALLPFTLFLPVELILYKVLMMEAANSIIAILLTIFFLWLYLRLIKGIYVIFDVRPLFVYLYSFIFVFVLLGGVLLKYQLTHSVFYYLSNAVMQYNSMIN